MKTEIHGTTWCMSIWDYFQAVERPLFMNGKMDWLYIMIIRFGDARKFGFFGQSLQEISANSSCLLFATSIGQI